MSHSPHRVHLTCLSVFPALAFGLGGCSEPTSDAEAASGSETHSTSADTSTSSSTDTDDTDTDTDTGTDTGGEVIESETITHNFGAYALSPYEETSPCVQWTLDNEAAIYAQAVTLSNFGYFHHSNWFVVPENIYAGDDGYFNCNDRNFSELGAASVGTVIFAQSTQSFVEEQRTGPGAIIKIPPRYKVVGATHMLNVGPAPVETDLWMSLELIHPRDVEVVLSPFRLTYYDLAIPPTAKSAFTGVCDQFGADYAGAAGAPMNMKLHYVLPHYHYLGNYFDLTLLGGEYDGESVYALDGFDGGANGRTFDPPLDLTGLTGLRFTCGYDNWRDAEVGWGIGDQEMCVMLGLAESDILMDVSVNGGTQAAGVIGDVLQYQASCDFLGVPKSVEQTMPTDAEIEAPFYVPPSGDPGVPPVPECFDHDPSVAPELPPTLENVADVVFDQSCSFNACHGSATAAAGLDLQSPNLLAELMDHAVVGNPGATLVEPGDPDSSWLFQIMASCEPALDGGGTAAHMPRNAPVLLRDESIALVREWIAAGALP